MLLFLRDFFRLVMIGIVDCKRRARVAVHHDWQQRIGVVWSLHENGIRLPLRKDLFDMAGARRTVMAHRNQHYFSHFLAS